MKRCWRRSACELDSRYDGGAGLGPKGAPALWLYDNAKAHGGTHVAFQRERVAPRSMPSTRPAWPTAAATTARPACGWITRRRYYAAFLIDPDGNNVEAVCMK